AEERRKHEFLQEGHVQLLNRVARRGELRTEVQRAPASAQEKAQLVLACRLLRGASVLQDERRIELLEQRLGRETIEVLQHAVVRKDLQLVVRKDHREEMAALAGALARLEDARGRGATMMTIGDVEGRDARKLRFDGSEGRVVGNRPRGMPHAVGRSKIQVGRRGRGSSNEFVEFRGGPISQEYGSGLRVQCLDM